jgi:quercetin dioxygenase-like cupin family protein
MSVGTTDDLPATRLHGEGLQGVSKRVAISSADGWEGWVMRVFDVEEGGHTPRHAHEWPHINYVVRGTGRLHLDGDDHELALGAYAFVPAGATHQFSNAGRGTFRFICIVPDEGEA